MVYRTLYGDWSSSSQTSAIRLVMEVDDLPALTPSMTSISTTIRFHIQSRRPLNDQNNWFGVYGDYYSESSNRSVVTDSSNWAWSVLVLSKSFNISFDSGYHVDIEAHADDIAGMDAELYTHFDLPSRPYYLPNPPTNPSVTRYSDTKFTFTWTNNRTSTSSGYPWDRVYVERWDNESNVWYAVSTLSGWAKSHVDTDTKADHVYQYRVRAWNSSGYSPYLVSSQFQTTISPHTNVTWSRPSTSATISWKQNSTIAVSTEIQYSTNGGSTWTSLATVGPGVTSTVHVSPNNTLTNIYRVRPVYNDTYGSYTSSSSMGPLSPPQAPTGLYPSGIVVDAAAPISFAFTHNPTDGTTQTAIEIEYREIGAPSFSTTGKISYTSNVYPFSLLVNNKSYEWHVRTWGQHATASAWSQLATVVTAASPVVTVHEPLDGATVVGMLSAIPITYYDAENSPQSRTVYTLYTSTDVPLYSNTIVGPATSLPFSYIFADATTYKLGVRVMDSTGLWSTEVINTFTTAFVDPPVPVVDARWDGDNGSAVLAIQNIGTTPIPPAYNQIWRDGVLIADRVALDTSYTDWIPPSSRPVEYRVIAVSGTPTYSDSPATVVTPDVSRCSQWVWINGGPGFSLVGRFRGSPDISTEFGLDKVLRSYFGRERAVVYTGTAVSEQASISGVLESTSPMSTAQRFRELNRSMIVCFRDSNGNRMFGTLGRVKFTHLPYGLMQFTTDLTVVDYSEQPST